MSHYSAPPPGDLARNLVTLGLVAVVIGLGYRVYQLERDRVEKPLDVARKQVDDLGAETRRSINSTSAAAATVPAPATAPDSSETKAPENPMAAMMAISAQMMNSPAIQDMMAAQQKREMERQYADILSQLQFTPDQRTRFFAAMLEGQKKEMELGMSLGMKMMSGEMGPSDKEDLDRQMTEAEKAARERMDAFFASEFPGDAARREAYDKYVDEMPVREELGAMQANFARAGQPLSTEQSTALFNLLTEDKTDSPSAGNSDDAVAFDMLMGKPNPEAIAAMIGEQEQSQNKIAERAASFLSPAQLTTLKENQASEREAMKTGMEFSSQMMSAKMPAAK